MADLEIVYEPITVNSGPVTVGVTGLDNVKVDAKLAITEPIETSSSLTLSVPEPVKTDSKFALSLPDPIRTETAAAIGLRPVVVDQCLRLSLGPLPPTQICLPSRQRLALSVFGVEVFGLTLEGEARVVVSDLPGPSHIVRIDSGKESPGCEQPGREAAEPAERKPPFVVRLGG